ncbi:MAG TPA: glyoxalase superfamily protein, partial [Terriglobales bacterium]|nr:glyoxalase superfamily protein [Terriglobales bacterium]
MNLRESSDVKPHAKRLREALGNHGIVLKHTNALEVLALMTGHGNWMRAKGATEPNAQYALLLTLDGQMKPPRVFPT